MVAFRESEVEFYQPSFTAPGYPYVQLFGVLGGLCLLTQMGLLPIAGAVGIIVASLLWYLLYARSRIDRVGALSGLLQRRRSRSDDAELTTIEPERDD